MNKSGQKFNVPCLVFMPDRAFNGSTDMCLYFYEFKGQKICVSLGIRGNEKPFAHMVFTYISKENDGLREKYLYQLSQVLEGDTQSPYPVVSLLGVLYLRTEAIEAQKSIDFYLQDLNRIESLSSGEWLGGCRHEI